MPRPTALTDTLASTGRPATAPPTEVIAMTHRDPPAPAGTPRPVRHRAAWVRPDPEARVDTVALLAEVDDPLRSLGTDLIEAVAESRGWPLVEVDRDPDDPLRCTLTVWDVLDGPRPRSAEEARARLARLGWDDEAGVDGDDA